MPRFPPGIANAIICRVGGVAQLGERRVRNAEVGSSILLLSTTDILRSAEGLGFKHSKAFRVITLGVSLDDVRNSPYNNDENTL